MGFGAGVRLVVCSLWVLCLGVGFATLGCLTWVWVWFLVRDLWLWMWFARFGLGVVRLVAGWLFGCASRVWVF